MTARDARRRLSSRWAWVPRLLVRVDRLIDRGRHESWTSALEVLADVPATSITVDVFDTVLTRRVAGDEALWWLTGKALSTKGCWSSTPADFVAARRAAARARPRSPLTELYQDGSLAGRMTCADAAMLEDQLEADLAVPVPGAVPALAELRALGHSITFVSDMHLGPDSLWRTLVRHGLAATDDRLVVSSDVGLSKSAGTLFPAVADTVTSSPLHIGNDLWSDVAMAERAGVSAVPLRVAEASGLEQLMAVRAGSVGSALAGAARLVRLEGARLPEHQAVLVEVGADVAGQCLSAFLLWVRSQCALAGASQVMFLARDGELPLEMARAMPADHWHGLQLDYLHGSRRLWSLAAAAVTGVDHWLTAGTRRRGFLRQQQHTIPWGSLLARAGLDGDDLVGHSALRALALDDPLPRHLDHAWRALLADATVRERIGERAAQQLADLQDLLVASGLGRGRVALVDVGWRGQLAWQVSAVLRSITGMEPVHLHFGGVDVAEDAAQADVRRFAVDDRHAPPPFSDFISCVETLTASGAARARATQRDAEGRVMLVFDPPQAQMQTEQRRLLRQSAVDVAACVPSRSTLAQWGFDESGLDLAVREVLTEFWTRPTARHGYAAQQLAAEVDDAGHGVHPVARPYGLAELLRSGSITRTWRQGSLRVTRQPMRSLLHLALRVKDARSAARTAPARPAPRRTPDAAPALAGPASTTSWTRGMTGAPVPRLPSVVQTAPAVHRSPTHPRTPRPTSEHGPVDTQLDAQLT